MISVSLTLLTSNIILHIIIIIIYIIKHIDRKFKIFNVSILIHVYISAIRFWGLLSLTFVGESNMRRRGDDKRHHRLARRYDGEIHNCHHF